MRVLKIKSLFKELKEHILFAVILSSILILIDFGTNLFFHNFYIESSKFTLQEIAITFFLSLLISYSSKVLRYFFSLLLILFSLIEIIYFSFFRGLIQPYHFRVVFSEADDILDSLYSVMPIVIASIFIFIISLFLIIKLSKKIKRGYRYINYLLIFIFLSLPIVSYFKPYSLSISPLNFSYLNMLYALSIATKNLFYTPKNKKFKPYIIKKRESKEQNIIVIMGESLSYKRMNIFGYDKNNTTNLNILKDNPNFFYTKAVSSGVNTPVSIVSFFTLKREPTNISILETPKTNLLKLANENGYNTAWFSMQDEGMSISSVLKYAKKIKLRKDYSKENYDNNLLEELKDINWSKKNFIVLHFRANHSPYEKYIPPKFKESKYNRLDYFKYKVDSYNDSIKYVDSLLYKIYRYMLDTNLDFKIYFTSDHGERLGYSDDHFKYGHSELDLEVAKVPFLVFSNRKVSLKKELTNHYKIGKIILNDLGYTLQNSNNDKTHYYINGLNIAGRAGFLEYTLDNFSK